MNSIYPFNGNLISALSILYVRNIIFFSQQALVFVLYFGNILLNIFIYYYFLYVLSS